MAIYFSFFVFFNQKTAYEMRISDWSSDVCSSDLSFALRALGMIEIGAVTFSVASVPSMVPSDFAVRLAIVAMIKTPSVARGPSPMELGRASCRERVCQYV